MVDGNGMATVCAFCGKAVAEQTGVLDEGLLFCNTLCRYEWRLKGKPLPEQSRPKEATSLFLTPSDFEFPFPVPGFEGQLLHIRISYWHKPHMFLNGARLKPFKRFYWKRMREYRITNDAGITAHVLLKFRFLDAIPIVSVDGERVPLAGPLRWWEYAWIGLPAFLMFISGGIGAMLGAAALFVNSILMRKIKQRIARYVATGFTTIAAGYMLFQALTIVIPWSERLNLRLHSTSPTNAALDDLTKYEWDCVAVLNQEGKPIVATNQPLYNTRRYFYGDGMYVQYGTYGKDVGQWQLDTANMVLTVTQGNAATSMHITRIDDHVMVMTNESSSFVHQVGE